MTSRAIAHARLRNSRLVGPGLTSPEDVVRWFGAVQSQDVPGALWGIAQRLEPDDGATIDELGAALDDGRIVRTHGPRPTWHFLAPSDLRWVLGLVGPRVEQANRAVHRRRLGLDDRDLERSEAVIRRLLAGGRALTRPELAGPIQEAGIAFSDPNTIAYVVMHAELRSVICNGPRRGTQPTYVLVDERVPPAPPLDRAAALRELTVRYFQSHGPALAHDMAWWSGLTVSVIREGIALAGTALERRRIEGKDYWAATGVLEPEPVLVPDGHVLLLPNYDEYLGSYADYGPILDDALPRARTIADVLGTHLVVRDGLVVGGWRRRLSEDRAVAVVTLLAPFTADDHRALAEEAARWSAFLGRPVDVHVSRG